MAKHLGNIHDQERALIKVSYQAYKSQRPELFGVQGTTSGFMNSVRKVRLALSANDQAHDVVVDALIDGSIRRAVIHGTAALATRGKVQGIQRTSVSGPDGSKLNSSSTIDLRWNYHGGLQTYQQTFYIVDNCGVADVQAVIGSCISPPDQQPREAHVFEMRPESKADKAAREKKDRESQIRYQAQIAKERQMYLAKMQGGLKSDRKR